MEDIMKMTINKLSYAEFLIFKGRRNRTRSLIKIS